MSALTGLYDPASVAVVGASADTRKWGYWLARGALSGRDRRQVFLVNRKGGTVLGEPCHPSLTGLPTAPECVVVAVPAQHAADVIYDGLRAGARYFIGVTAAVAAESELAEAVRAAGARLLGPNCMGVVDPGNELCLSWGEFPAGRVGLVSQSGNLGLELGRLLARAGHGYSRFVSLGNQADIDAVEVIEDLIDHEPTRLITCYLEAVRDGRRLVEAAARARAAGKPLLLLTVGASEASGRAAASHTGALVTGLAVVDAACRAAGAVRLGTPGELVDAVQVLLGAARPAGRRVAVVGDSGGQGAIAADVMATAGLDLPMLPADLDWGLPAHAGTGNPVDLAGAGEADLTTYARLAELLLGRPELDAVVLTGYFGDYAGDAPALAATETEVARRLGSAARRMGKPLVVHTMAAETPAVSILREAGVPVVPRIEQAAAGLAAAARWAAGSVAVRPRSSLQAGVDGGYWPVRRLLEAHGVDFPPGGEVDSAEAAVAVAGDIGYPVVLKAMGVAHKTDAGGVVLGLADEEALRAAFAGMAERTRAGRFSVEAMVMVRDGVELLVGVRRDRSYGPVVVVGMGGVTAELAADTRTELAPVDPEQALGMLRSLRCFPLLLGWRGAPPVDLAAAAAVVSAVSMAGAAQGGLAELEVNPLLVAPGGAIALDAHGVPG